MHVNNYNTNANGLDVEFSGFYDTPLSHMKWEDNFERIKGMKTRYGGNEIYFYTDNGQLSLESLYDFEIKGHIAKKRKACKDNSPYYESNWAADDINDALIDFVKTEGIDEAEPFLDEYGVTVRRKHAFERVSIRGYSQGDYAEIMVDVTACTELWGNEPDLDSLKEYFTNLFYDSLVYAALEVEGEEFRYDEVCESRYKWDKEDFIKKAMDFYSIDIDKSQRQELQSTLESIVPENLDYS